jgi:hypothetical protein
VSLMHQSDVCCAQSFIKPLWYKCHTMYIWGLFSHKILYCYSTVCHHNPLLTLTLYIYSILLSHSLVCFQLIQGYKEYYSLLSKILELWLANDTSIKTHTWTLLITTPDTLFYSVESLRCLHSLMVILLMSINTWLFNEDILIVNILWMEFLTYLLNLVLDRTSVIIPRFSCRSTSHADTLYIMWIIQINRSGKKLFYLIVIKRQGYAFLSVWTCYWIFLHTYFIGTI